MKFLYFHQHFSTPSGSTGTRSYEFARSLVRNGHQVTMVCGSYWIARSGLSGEFVKGIRKGMVDGINVIELELPYSNADGLISRSILFFRYSIMGIRIVLNYHYDLIFASSTPLTAGIPGIVAKLIRRKPFIFEVRDLWPELPRAMGVVRNPIILKLMDVLETVSYKYADKCIALAPGISAGIKSKYPHKKVAIIPNGSDHFDSNGFVKKTGRKPLIAAFTGAHGQANGLGSVLDAAKYLKEQNVNDIQFQFIGDGKLKPDLIKRAETEKLNNCTFLSPFPKRELFEYLYENVDVGMMILDNIPAFYNGTSPNKFFDYISLGLPVINNYPGWLAELITSHECGVVVEPGNPCAFAEALIRIKDNAETKLSMGENARTLAKQKYDRNILAETFVKVLVADC